VDKLALLRDELDDAIRRIQKESEYTARLRSESDTLLWSRTDVLPLASDEKGLGEQMDMGDLTSSHTDFREAYQSFFLRLGTTQSERKVERPTIIAHYS